MQQANWFEGFDRREIHTGDSSTVLRIGGKAGTPALVLLHGFPQTHVMWHRVAERLRDRFTIVMPDLRG
jgi:haloacetate dehalogenase